MAEVGLLVDKSMSKYMITTRDEQGVDERHFEKNLSKFKCLGAVFIERNDKKRWSKCKTKRM